MKVAGFRTAVVRGNHLRRGKVDPQFGARVATVGYASSSKSSAQEIGIVKSANLTTLLGAIRASSATAIAAKVNHDPNLDRLHHAEPAHRS